MYRKNGNLSTILHTKVERWHNILSDQENDLGQRYLQPTKVGDVWAAVIPQTGTLLRGRVADTTLARTTHKIVIRYDSTLKADEWFVYNGQRYNILYIMDPYLNHERLEVFCEVET